MTFQIRETTWAEDCDSLRAIREIVFIKGQNVPQELEWDDRDEHCWHVIATINDQTIATGRLDTNGKIGRMAVLEEYRGHGLGKKVLTKLIHIARREQIDRTFLHAQVHALPFYLENGFKKVGEMYDKAGIPHQNAEEILSVENLVFSDALNKLVEAIQQSEHSLKIKLHDINHAILCAEGITDAIRSKAVTDRHYKIQILLENTRPGRRVSSFIRNYQRLTDKIEVKKYIPPQAEADRRQFLIVDKNLIAWQPSPESSNIRLLRAKDRLKNFTEDFQRIFSHAERDISLVKLYL